MTEVYSGRPPANIEDWILNRQQKGMFDILSENLENFNDCTIESLVQERLEKIDPYVLPKVGSTVLVDYVVDPTVGPVKTEWQVLGYNMSIPERIKYKNENDVIYVTTIGPGGLLSSIGEGTLVYADKSSSDSIGMVLTTSGVDQVTDGNTGTYGNNNPYNAPTSVSVGGKEYSFAGWNMTLMSKYGLAAKFDNTLFVRSQFNSTNRNDWSVSQIRTWMNGSSAVENQTWWTSNITPSTTGTITGLLSRLPDEKFLKAISPCVNRTWVHSSWRNGKTDSNQCEHVVDKFWLLDVAAVNCKGSNTTSYFPDGGATVDGDSKGYGTSRYSDIFNETDVYTPEKTRKMKMMKEDGSEGSACYWWFRSAYSNGGGGVGYVDDGGSVYSGSADGYSACSPVCLIQ